MRPAILHTHFAQVTRSARTLGRSRGALFGSFSVSGPRVYSLVHARHSVAPAPSTKPPLQALHHAYRPHAFESSWYEWWERQGYFSPLDSETTKNAKKETFRMIVPPPNITGALHIGHALTFSIQDAQVRWRRMLRTGPVTWIPGTDHAGIGTQTVVERWLERTGRPGREELGREAFEHQVMQWKEMYGGTIHGQLRRLGASLSWKDRFFTLDSPRSTAVTEAFVRLHQRGLIYRDTRMVNWCPALKTAISDMEIEWKDIEGRTDMTFPGRATPVRMGLLYHIAYPLLHTGNESQGRKELIVATTRPETLLADVALAVHPQDQRYKVDEGTRGEGENGLCFRCI